MNKHSISAKSWHAFFALRMNKIKRGYDNVPQTTCDYVRLFLIGVLKLVFYVVGAIFLSLIALLIFIWPFVTYMWHMFHGAFVPVGVEQVPVVVVCFLSVLTIWGFTLEGVKRWRQQRNEVIAELPPKEPSTFAVWWKGVKDKTCVLIKVEW